jgi:hypothetical protein
MGRSHTSDRWKQLADEPWDVQITVVPAPPGRVAGARVAGIPILTAARALIAAVVTLAVIGAVVVDVLPAHSVTPSAPVRPVSRSVTESPYRYPLGCMGAWLSTAGRWSVREARGASPCWRYGVYVTAVLRQVRGVWSLALEAVSPSCPAVSLPRFIQERLVVCRRPMTGPGAARVRRLGASSYARPPR